jgi:hypothetical protein
MRWEVTTEKDVYVIAANGSADAVAKVKQSDTSTIKSAKILPKNATDKVKSLWRKLIN